MLAAKEAWENRVHKNVETDVDSLAEHDKVCLNDGGKHAKCSTLWNTYKKVKAEVDELQRFNEAHSSAENGSIAFLDEINTALPIQQAVILAVLDSKRVGDTFLGDYTALCAAANPPDIAVNGQEFAPPTTSRFVHIYWPDHDKEPFIQGAFKGGDFPVPEIPEITPAVLEKAAKFRGEMWVLIATFARTRGHLIQNIPETDAERSTPFPTRRTWSFVARTVGMSRALGYDAKVEDLLIRGAIGMGVQVEFLQFIKQLDLIDPEELLVHPERAKPLNSTDKLYATGYGIRLALENKNTLPRYQNAIKALENIAGDGSEADALLGVVTDILGMSTPKELDWVIDNFKTSPLAKKFNGLSARISELKASSVLQGF
jgi:hypothetical protein